VRAAQLVGQKMEKRVTEDSAFYENQSCGERGIRVSGAGECALIWGNQSRAGFPGALTDQLI